MIKIVVDKNIPFIEGALDPYAELNYLPAGNINNLSVRNVDALVVRSRTACNETLLKGTNVKFITSATIGHDHIDKDYCNRAGIKWSNAPGCNARSVVQYVASALINLAVEKDFELSGRVLGIVGVGEIGSRVATIAKSLGLKVLLNDPPRERKEGGSHFVTLEYLLAKSDIVTIHVPLNIDGLDRTLHLVDNAFLCRMKKGSYFINTSRGEVVSEDDLLNHILDKRMRGAILDVWENEPEIDRRLLKAALFATPHIAGYSLEGKANGTAMSVKAIADFFNFEMESWYPAEFPSSEIREIVIPKGSSRTEVLWCAINSAYNIRNDSMKLMTDPGRFEHYRDNYPVRREFSAYKVMNDHIDKATLALLKELGFICQ
jgi:erythronate-4-phosphate dehydrogenase